MTDQVVSTEPRRTDRQPDHLQVARVLGIPIYVHASWLIVFGLILWTLSTGYFPSRDPDLPTSSYWARGLAASLLFFVSILLHELGHAAVALHHGLRTRSITLFLFGGVAQLEADPRDGRVEFRMAAAGPLVSFALAALFYLCALLPFAGPSVVAVARYMAFTNLALALFNLVPAFPMDGGRLLRGVLWGPLGKTRATRIATGAGDLFGLFLIFTGLFSLLGGVSIAAVWSIVIGWFIRNAAAVSNQQVRFDEALKEVKVREAMLEEVHTVPAAVSVADAVQNFLRTGHGRYPVVRGDAVVGVLSLKDVRRLSPEERESTSVQGAMGPLTDDIVTDPDAPLLEAIGKMVRAGTTRLIVVHEGRLAGLLTLSAVIRRVRMREALAG